MWENSRRLQTLCGRSAALAVIAGLTWGCAPEVQPPTAPSVEQPGQPSTPSAPVSPPPAPTPVSNAPAFFIWKPGEDPVRIAAPDGVSGIEPVAFNNKGEVVGATLDAAGSRTAFVWTPESGYLRMEGVHGLGKTTANDINDEGVVTGTIWLTYSRGARAFVWSREAGALVIGDGTDETTAVAINAAGEVAGTRNGSAFLWSRDDGVRLLPPNGNPEASLAAALNDNRDVVMSGTGRYERGFDYGWAYPSRPWIWNKSSSTDLQCTDCIVAGINNSREVVGTLWGSSQAFRWDASSGLQMLATPAGLQSEAIAISESGTVAGSLVRWNGSTVSEAVVWTTAKNLIPIPPIPGILSTSARDVDAEGRVLIHAR